MFVNEILLYVVTGTLRSAFDEPESRSGEGLRSTGCQGPLGPYYSVVNGFNTDTLRDRFPRIASGLKIVTIIKVSACAKSQT